MQTTPVTEHHPETKLRPLCLSLSDISVGVQMLFSLPLFSLSLPLSLSLSHCLSLTLSKKEKK